MEYDEYGFPVDSSTYNVTNENLKNAIKKILAFKNYKIDVLPEDILNIFISEKCISTYDMKNIIEEYKNHASYPQIPESWVDYTDRLR